MLIINELKYNLFNFNFFFMYYLYMKNEEKIQNNKLIDIKEVYNFYDK